MSEFFRTLADAETHAAAETERTGDIHVAADNGEWVSPRYGSIRAPKVGDKVSYTFNGDYYPCGVITRVSESLRVVKTDTGKTFYRRRKSGTWKMEGGTWSLVYGHVSRLNPSF